MTANLVSRNTAPKQPKNVPLFDPFPEPQTYPARWDGTALEMLSRPKPSKPKSKSQA